MIAKSRPRCVAALEEPVDVLEEHVPRLLEMQEAVDVPPQHALLALDAAGLGQGPGHAVVLAGEAPDHHVYLFRDAVVVGAELVVVEHLLDVLVDAAALAEAGLVAAPRELLGLVSGGFPLVGPDRLERPCCWHVEFWVIGVAVAVKAQAKAPDAGEELGDSDGLHGTFLLCCCAVYV